MSLADKPAFPTFLDSEILRRMDGGTAKQFFNESRGATLRELYAGIAMQGLLSCSTVNLKKEDIVNRSVQYADALIAELEKGEGK